MRIKLINAPSRSFVRPACNAADLPLIGEGEAPDFKHISNIIYLVIPAFCINRSLVAAVEGKQVTRLFETPRQIRPRFLKRLKPIALRAFDSDLALSSLCLIVVEF